ncbi:monovalent cation/H(+) antiporter subunit G [Thauera sp. WH-1]|uniref:monovalent cation/H(+) antiporter subunit G n=1 Tax=Thauera sp. WH-1 TaxID=3398230 RepID=UPI0039FDBBED
MMLIAVLQGLLISAGVAFFVVGSIGVLRFPDVYTRIHALTKADNLGLGLVVLGLLPGAESVAAALKLLLVWILALLASACSGYLVARAARRRGIAPWQRAPSARPAEDGR